MADLLLIPRELAEELITAVLEVCRADGKVPPAEAEALRELAEQLSVSIDDERLFFQEEADHSPEELAARMAALLTERGPYRDDPGLTVEALTELFAVTAERVASADGEFSEEERVSLGTFVAALRARSRMS